MNYPEAPATRKEENIYYNLTNMQIKNRKVEH